MSQIPAFNPTDTALRETSPNGFSSLDSADFIRIMFTELANQDPFQPSDSSALLDQMNSIRSIESNIDLMDRLDTLVFENKLSSAANLIGKTVQGLSDQGLRVAGTVRTVLRQGDDVTLQSVVAERNRSNVEAIALSGPDKLIAEDDRHAVHQSVRIHFEKQPVDAIGANDIGDYLVCALIRQQSVGLNFQSEGRRFPRLRRATDQRYPIVVDSENLCRGDALCR